MIKYQRDVVNHRVLGITLEFARMFFIFELGENDSVVCKHNISLTSNTQMYRQKQTSYHSVWTESIDYFFLDIHGHQFLSVIRVYDDTFVQTIPCMSMDFLDMKPTRMQSAFEGTVGVMLSSAPSSAENTADLGEHILPPGGPRILKTA